MHLALTSLTAMIIFGDNNQRGKQTDTWQSSCRSCLLEAILALSGILQTDVLGGRVPGHARNRVSIC